MLIYVGSRTQEWCDSIYQQIPNIEIRVWPDLGKKEEINCALIWDPQSELFKDLVNLEVIFSLGAGVDHLIQCPSLPANIPIVRMVDKQLTAGMVEYCLFNILRFHRSMHCYEKQQTDSLWNALPQAASREITVGIMGVGVLGRALANSLLNMNYKVIGFRRRKKPVDGIEIYYGASMLEDFLSKVNILVILLPKTSDTRHIINSKTLKLMPRNSFLINAGRGDLVCERDLLRLINEGHIQAAALDVFEHEPLSRKSELWINPNVYITPHIASNTCPESSSMYIAKAIFDYRKGKLWPNVVEVDHEY